MEGFKKIACFMQSEEGMEPVGIYTTQVDAVGSLIVAMQAKLAYMAGANEDNIDDLHLMFSEQMEATKDAIGKGFRILGAARFGSVAMLSDDIQWIPCGEKGATLTGYGLYMKEEA